MTVWRAEDIRRWIAQQGQPGDGHGNERGPVRLTNSGVVRVSTRSAPTRPRRACAHRSVGPFFGDGGALGLMTKSRAFPGVFAG